MCAFSPLRPLHAPDRIIGHGPVPGALAAPACARVSLAQGHGRQTPGSGQDVESGRARRGLFRLARGRTPPPRPAGTPIAGPADASAQPTSPAGTTMPASAYACAHATHPLAVIALRGCALRVLVFSFFLRGTP